jgi:hypothetical protein
VCVPFSTVEVDEDTEEEPEEKRKLPPIDMRMDCIAPTCGCICELICKKVISQKSVKKACSPVCKGGCKVVEGGLVATAGTALSAVTSAGFSFPGGVVFGIGVVATAIGAALSKRFQATWERPSKEPRAPVPVGVPAEAPGPDDPLEPDESPDVFLEPNGQANAPRAAGNLKARGKKVKSGRKPGKGNSFAPQPARPANAPRPADKAQGKNGKYVRTPANGKAFASQPAPGRSPTSRGKTGSRMSPKRPSSEQKGNQKQAAPTPRPAASQKGSRKRPPGRGQRPEGATGKQPRSGTPSNKIVEEK